MAHKRLFSLILFSANPRRMSADSVRGRGRTLAYAVCTPLANSYSRRPDPHFKYIKKMIRTDDVLLAIDQGTSSTRAIGFSAAGDVLAVEQQSFEQIYPGPGLVEHDPEVIWATAMSPARRVLQRRGETKQRAAAIGITNQRETTVLWDRRSGVPLH